MTADLLQVHAARHGETAWSVSGLHTGLTDIPLTPQGMGNARRLGARLQGIEFQYVLTSPLQRALQTCELAGFGDRAETDQNLAEWNYGEYERRTSEDIRRQRPGWNLFRDGCPGGESLDEVASRADRVVFRLRNISHGNVLIFSHMHFLRVLAARWVGLPSMAARRFYLNVASLSILGYERALDSPAIRLWNDDCHLRSNR
jgi:broad specificity phosphatase PhoE